MAVKTADVFLNQVDARGGNVEGGVVCKSQRQIFLAAAVLVDGVHAGEFGDAVGDVDDVVAGFQVEERVHRS